MKSLNRRLEKLEKENNGTPDLVVTHVPVNASKDWKPKIWSKKKNTVTFLSKELLENFKSIGGWGECEKVTCIFVPPKMSRADYEKESNRLHK